MGSAGAREGAGGDAGAGAGEAGRGVDSKAGYRGPSVTAIADQSGRPRSVAQREPNAESADDRAGDPVERPPRGLPPQAVTEHSAEADQQGRPDPAQQYMDPREHRPHGQMGGCRRV